MFMLAALIDEDVGPLGPASPPLEAHAVPSMILLVRCVNSIWVWKMTSAVLRSTSPTRDAWCTGRRVS
jgi:hypothetical protein